MKRPYYEDGWMHETANFVRSMKPPTRKDKAKKAASSAKRNALSIIYALVLGGLIIAVFMIANPAKSSNCEAYQSIIPINKVREETVMYPAIMSRKSTVISDWENRSNSTSCRGVELFDTNESFLSDWKGMMTKYYEVYGADDNPQMKLLSPAAMFEKAKGFDCEDMAHASRCLAKEHDVDCRFWVEEPLGELIPDKRGHLGICCEATPGEWLCI